MAATKFTAIYVNNEGKIIEREIPGMNTYKIAEKFAIMLNDPKETKLVCVVESWKLYPNENEKTEKKKMLLEVWKLKMNVILVYIQKEQLKKIGRAHV